MRPSFAAPRGLTLFELAVTMIVTGLLLVGLLALIDILRQQQSLRATRQRLETVQQRLDAFADKAERFPCPVPPAAGVMGASPASCPSHPPGEPLKDGARDVVAGLIPVVALALSPEQAVDGWGHPFTYAVSAALAQEGGMAATVKSGVIGPTPGGVIGVVDGAGANVLDSPDTARYVLVSHGPTGAGAFAPNGASARACPAAGAVSRNCSGAGIYATAPWSRAAGPRFFDNIVAADGLRRQAKLLEHLDACGREAKYYAPANPNADRQGCVAADKIYGACTYATVMGGDNLYMVHGIVGTSAPTGIVRWQPAMLDKDSGACDCAVGYKSVKAATWQVPLPQQPKLLTPQQYCRLNVQQLAPAVIDSDCNTFPPNATFRYCRWNGAWSPDTPEVAKDETGIAKGDCKPWHTTWDPITLPDSAQMALYICEKK